jgi:hypothetical protein
MQKLLQFGVLFEVEQAGNGGALERKETWMTCCNQ